MYCTMTITNNTSETSAPIITTGAIHIYRNQPPSLGPNMIMNYLSNSTIIYYKIHMLDSCLF